MIWSVWHEWPSVMQFIFNCNRRWDTLVVRNRGKVQATYFIVRRE